MNLLHFAVGLIVQRLFSTFADGWAGAGLLLMRLVIGIALIYYGVTGLWSDASILLTALSVFIIGAGLLSLAGLWTPITGTLVAATQVWKIFLQPEYLWICILLGTIGAALAMIGPGAWSIDAHLFGRKHIEIREG